MTTRGMVQWSFHGKPSRTRRQPTRRNPLDRTIKARVHHVRIEPSEPQHLPEASDLFVTVTKTGVLDEVDATVATAGAWNELLDCRALEKDLYESRLLNPRAVSI